MAAKDLLRVIVKVIGTQGDVGRPLTSLFIRRNQRQMPGRLRHKPLPWPQRQLFILELTESRDDQMLKK